jgi:hypothetical protein
MRYRHRRWRLASTSVTFSTTQARLRSARLTSVDIVSIMTTHTVVIPGIQNGPHTPLLMFFADAAELRGSQVTPIYWDPPREFRKDRSQASQWIYEQIELALDGLDADEPPLLIAKSLGTLRR